MQYCPILVIAFLQLIFDDLLSHRLEHPYPSVYAPVLFKEPHLEDLQPEDKIPQRSLLQDSISKKLTEPNCNLLILYLLIEGNSEESFHYRISRY